MQHLKKRYNDSILWGLMASLLASIFGLAMVYVLKFMGNNVSLSQYIGYLKNEPSFRSAILSLGLLANIPLVYYIQQRRLYKSFKGLAIVVICLGLLIVINKFNLF